ncbi:MAG: nitroreductase family protein [Muribaculaceae bacterium]|nr:nitroreductase family protein [Muribaculaceae bacterium]
MTKSTEQTLLERRSIRRYERESIKEEDLTFIREAIRNTPTSYNGQQFSVIEISDQDLKEELEALVGQKQLKTSARVYIFLSDFHKISVAAQAKGLEMPPFNRTVDGFIVGTVDAALAMMSAIVAAESRGLGTCPIGYARTVDPAAISELLGLPQDVYVVCALAVGVPREIPELKPKQPRELVIFENSYGTDDMAERLLDYDARIVEYHQHRSTNASDADWVSEMLGYYREGMNYTMLESLRSRGYLLIDR